MDAVVWSDYICPWCYAGLDRTALLEQLGVTVTVLPYELHPRIPPGGVERPVPRERWERVAAECAAAGLPFRAPARVPNSRLALEAAEVVRHLDEEAFGRLHAALFRAHFAAGEDIGDAGVVYGLAESAGADPDAVRRAVGAGSGARSVEASMARARQADVAGTPAWLIDGSLLVPGVQPRSFFERAVGRMQQRRGPAAS